LRAVSPWRNGKLSARSDDAVRQSWAGGRRLQWRAGPGERVACRQAGAAGTSPSSPAGPPTNGRHPPRRKTPRPRSRKGCPGMGAATRTIIRMGIRAHAPSLVVAPARPSTHAFWSALNSQEGILSSQINASPSGARLRSTTQAWAYRRVWADYTTNMFEFEFPTGQTIVWRGLAASPILKGNLPGR
jgi:hypothetical protein